MNRFQLLSEVEERKLQESYDRLNELLKQSGSFAWEINLDGVYTFVSPIVESVLGYKVDDLVDKKHFYDILTPSTREKLRRDAFQVMHNRKSLNNHEKKVLKADGTEIWLSTNCKPLLNEQNELIGYIGSDTDISKQKELLETLDEARKSALNSAKAKETFLTNMSHEIRTPLNVIIGMIREIGKEPLLDSQKGYLKHAESSAYHLLSIINNVLDMSKIEAREFNLDIKDFSLSAVLSNVNSILSSRASGKKITFEVTSSALIARALKGDSLRLSQVLINLLGNSIKFTDQGFVKLDVNLIHTNSNSQTISFKVSDSGIGMSEEYLKNIFRKFTQENDSSNRTYEGTGLGMSISKEIIELMGGRINVQSKKGIGTIINFEIKFPLGVEDNLIRIDKTTRNYDISGTKVLVVEDNEMNRFIAKQSLIQANCLVTEAENGLYAIEALKQNAFDIVLMDVQMPVMDGVSATKEIRHVLNSKTPIIALTANAFKHDIDLYLNSGMDDFLIKPYKEEELYAKIKKNLHRDMVSIPVSNPKLQYSSLDPDLNKIQLFNVNQLKVIANGDMSFVSTMLKMFKSLSETTIEQLHESLKANDIDKLRKLAHKIKPSLDNLEINILYNEVRMLEVYNEATGCADNLNKIVDFISTTLQRINKQIDESGMIS